MAFVRDLLLLAASVFYMLGALGCLRLGDVFSRLHAASKCSTTAFLMMFLAQLVSPITMSLHVKLVLIILFHAATVPVATQLIALSLKALYLEWKR